MTHTKKPLSVFVIRQPDGKFKVTDQYNKTEIFTPEEFARYVDSKVTAASAVSNYDKETVEKIKELLAYEDIEGAIKVLDQIL